ALGEFWQPLLAPSRKGTQWLNVLKTLTVYRLLDPGSEWRLHRQWFDRSSMADLLGEDASVAGKNTLYRCLDKVLAHKEELFSFLRGRWADLFGAKFDVLLYDLTSTYFEANAHTAAEGSKKRHGYSRDHRPDCQQVVIALVVTPEGFPLAYEVMPGNTADSTTLREFLAKIEERYGKINRTWLMDRGIPTEEVLGFLAYCLQVTLKNMAKSHATGLTPRAISEQVAQMQMIDVHLPTTDRRTIVLSRYTQPNRDLALLLAKLGLDLPAPPPPRITANKQLAI